MECNFTFKRVTNIDTTYCFKSYLPIKARNLVLVCGFCFIVFYIYGCKLKKNSYPSKQAIGKISEKIRDLRFEVCDLRKLQKLLEQVQIAIFM